MKIQQTDNQLEIKVSGVSSAVASVVFILLGVFVTYMLLQGGMKDSSGKSASPALALIGILMVVIGAFVGWIAQNKYVLLVKNGNCLVRTKRIFSGQTQEKTFTDVDVQSVSLNSFMDYSNSRRNNNDTPQRKSKLSLIMKNNDELEIATEGGKGIFSVNGISLGAFRKAPLSDEAEQISKFLGVPLHASDQSFSGSMKNIVSTLKGDDDTGGDDATTASTPSNEKSA